MGQFKPIEQDKSNRRQRDLCIDLDIGQKTCSSDKVGKGALDP